MNEELQKRTKIWTEMERKTSQQREEAEKFYEEHLLGLIEKDFIERNQAKVENDVQYFVVSVGTSFQPVVLNLKLFKPQKILFLYTKMSERTLDKVITYCGLEPHMYEKKQVSGTNSLDTYREFKKYYLEWGRPQKMYIDFSGGTKTMSGAMAMAGALTDVQLVYVGSNDYLADLRMPNPGSETLYYINNPLAVFGDLEIEKALLLFKEFNYAGAKAKLAELKEVIPDPNIRQQINFVYLLARAYEAWDALDFIRAYDTMVCLNEELERDRGINPSFLLMDCSERLHRQEEILKQLQNIPIKFKAEKDFEILKTKDLIIALMFTLYQNGIMREQQGKYDMATLLFYRLLEMIEQRRLSHYNVYVSEMDYENIEYNFENMPEAEHCSKEERVGMLKDKVYKIRQKVFEKDKSSELPEKVDLMAGYILLYALGDPIMTTAKIRAIDQLKKMRSKVDLRDNSIFAHGLRTVGSDDYSGFKSLVTEIFVHFCQIENVEFTEYIKDMEWIDPMKTKYYTFGTRGNDSDIMSM